MGTNNDAAQAYRATRGRILEIVVAAADGDLAVRAPATPEWRVRDVLAHLAGVSADILAGNLDGVASDAWTAAQVDARRGRPVADLVAEWSTKGPQVEELLGGFPADPVSQLIADTATHEHDIRGGLETPGARDSEAVVIGCAWMLRFVGTARERAGAGALAIETERGRRIVGDGEPTGVLRAPEFEVFRAVTGRRAREQIEAFDWVGDGRPDLLVLAPIFSARTTPLVE